MSSVRQTTDRAGNGGPRRGPPGRFLVRGTGPGGLHRTGSGPTAIAGRTVGLGLGRPGTRVWPLAVGVPLVGAAVCYAVASALGLLHPWPPPGLSPSSLLVSAAIATALVLGKEVGWRGFRWRPTEHRQQVLTGRRPSWS